MLRARERVVEVDVNLLVAPLEGSSRASGFWAGGELRRVLLAAVLVAGVLSWNLSNPASLEPASWSNTGGDSHGRVNGRWARWTTERMRLAKRRPVAQANMSTLRWAVLAALLLR
jgi:hypothetical protein